MRPLSRNLIWVARIGVNLQFRKKAYGCRLSIAAGTAVRFEPGQKPTVELIKVSGSRIIYGFTGKVMGKLK